MTKKILLAAVAGVIGVAHVGAADQRDVGKIREKYHSVRPRATDLAIYELDWAPTLKAAREQAAEQERPIFLIFVTNSFGNGRSGHC